MPILYCRAEFIDHGLCDVVTLECRDVISNGFGVDGIADAGMFINTLFKAYSVVFTVFLDLPSPWLVIPAAKQAMKVCYYYTV